MRRTIELGLLAVGLLACGQFGPVATAGSPTASPALVVRSTTPEVPSGSAVVGDGPTDAVLAAEGGDPVAGELGSWTWPGSGSDSPWLPGAPIAVGAGEPLSVTMAAGIAIGEWTARMVPAGAAPGGPVRPLGAGSTLVRFDAPEPGVWSVAVMVTFAGSLGSATYYWRLVVT